MSLEKSELKIAIVHELGCGFDDAREAAFGDLHRNEGAVAALRSGSKLIDSLKAHIEKDLDEGKLPTTFETELEVAALLKRWVERARGVAISLAEKFEANRLRCEGRVQGLEHSVKTAKEIHKAELVKAEAIRAAAELDPPDPSKSNGTGPTAPVGRPTGTHPGPSLSTQRKAESAAQGRQGKGPDTPKKRTRRRKKSSSNGKNSR